MKFLHYLITVLALDGAFCKKKVASKKLGKTKFIKFCILKTTGNHCMGTTYNADYPLNAGSALSFIGSDKLLVNPTVIPVFYGSGTYWDSSTTNILSNAFQYLPSSDYFSLVFALMNTAPQTWDTPPSFKMSKSKIYYGPQSLSTQTLQNNVISMLSADQNIGVTSANTIIMVIIDPIYSHSSLFKLSGGASYDSPVNGFCGFHSSVKISLGTVPFSMQGTGGSSCQWKIGSNYALPNSGFIDIGMSVFTHELSEILTDPFGGGFIDDKGYENGDKCAGYPGGFEVIASSNKIYNLILGTNYFLVQAQYDALFDDCPSVVFY
jgi:hypothetical protein